MNNLEKNDRKATKTLYRADRLTFATFMQLKLGHGYFKSYLSRISTDKQKDCIKCKTRQSPEHLLLNCSLYKEEQKQLKQQMSESKRERKMRQVTLQQLFNTNRGIECTLKYLKETRIATRRWILGEIEERQEG